jgi:hypothetical protein
VTAGIASVGCALFPGQKKTDQKKSPAFGKAGLVGGSSGSQAIDTAMKANKKINTPPHRGNTMGISGTMASIASTSCFSSLEWLGAGADMAFPGLQCVAEGFWRHFTVSQNHVVNLWR